MSYPVRFGIQTPQQNSNSWPDMLSMWQEVEQLGFDTAWVFDHFLPIFSDPTGPCMEGWTSLAALAMATSQIRLGVMVSGNTYRNPGVLAKIATTVDIISRGRLILGMGGGWFAREHAAFGIPFPGIGERLGRLEESLSVIKQLWSQDTTSYTGRYYQLDDAPFLPKPIQQPHPPILGRRLGRTGGAGHCRPPRRYVEQLWATGAVPAQDRQADRALPAPPA